MKFTKVITHGGTFHADEVLAIVTLRKLGVISKLTPIERVMKLEEEIPSDVLVLDFGGQFNGINLFDHHQDENLPASNLLVLQTFCDAKLAQVLTDNFFGIVSDTDKGITKSLPASFTQLISNFNMMSGGFEMALSFAEMALDAAWQVATESIRLENKWVSLDLIFNGKARIQEDSEFIPNWKSLAEKEDVLLLIAPNARSGWQIVSRNSDVLSIPKGYEGQTFCHNTGFMAVYETKDIALNHAALLCHCFSKSCEY